MNGIGTGAGVPIDPRHVRCPVLVITAALDGSKVPKDRRIADFYGADDRHADGIGHELIRDEGREHALEVVIGWLERDERVATRA